MWDRARTIAGLDRLHDTISSTSHLHHHTKHKPRFISVDSADSDSVRDGAYYSAVCQSDFALFHNNALGIAGLRQRDYDGGDNDNDDDDDICFRGKTAAAISLAPCAEERSPTAIPVEDATPSTPIIEPPPRNPRRLLRQFAPAPLFHEPEIITDSEAASTSDGDGYSSSPTSNCKLASNYSYGRPALEQISPPSSPDVAALRYGPTEDVSPIDDDNDFFQQNLIKGNPSTQTSKPQYQQGHAAISQRNHYSSRMVTPGQAFNGPRPVENAPAIQGSSLPRSNWMGFGSTDRTSSQPTSHHRRPSNGAPPSFGQRLRFLGRSKTEFADDQPLLEYPNPAPLNIPRRSSKRVSSRIISAPLPISSLPHSERPFPGIATTDRDLLPSKLNPNPISIAPPSSRLRSPAQSASGTQVPSPPLDEYSRSNTPVQFTRAQSPFGLNIPPGATNVIRRKPPPSNMPHPLNSSPVYSDTPPRQAPAPVATPSSAEKTLRRPRSRFSITNFTTSNSVTPQQPTDDQVPAAGQASSIRRRESPLSGRESPDMTNKNPIAIPIRGPYWPSHENMPESERPSSHRTHSRTNSSPNPNSHRASTSKPLPLAPPELSTSDDQITQLNIRLASLAHRRVNIIRSIKQMTELMPKDNLMASREVLRKREIEKQKVEGLKQELSEIQREEYELGLKLHRAYKRQNKGADYEPTTLWVRRVTS